MADLDDFFAKKDKKKKGKKAFSKANTEVLAKNLEENDRKEQQAEEKATDIIQRGSRPIEDQAGTKEVIFWWQTLHIFWQYNKQIVYQHLTVT